MKRCLLVLCYLVPALAAEPSLDAALQRIYSFDFAKGRALAHEYSARHQDDPLGHAVIAAVDLFAELERLKLLSLEPGSGKVQGQPDSSVWTRIETAAKLTDQVAQPRLAKNANDAQALMALMLVRGVERDYLALVEKSYRRSWVSARLAQQYALQLTVAHPDLQDAWFTIGFSDYLVSSVPFFLKPFMRMEGAAGNRTEALANLRKAALSGRYLKGFAQLILAQIYSKANRQTESAQMLRRLAIDYPDNPIAIRERIRARQSE